MAPKTVTRKTIACVFRLSADCFVKFASASATSLAEERFHESITHDCPSPARYSSLVTESYLAHDTPPHASLRFPHITADSSVELRVATHYAIMHGGATDGAGGHMILKNCGG